VSTKVEDAGVFEKSKTLYSICDTGASTALEWLTLLSKPVREAGHDTLDLTKVIRSDGSNEPKL